MTNVRAPRVDVREIIPLSHWWPQNGRYGKWGGRLGATLADKEQLRILKQGYKAWNVWRREAGEETRIDLSRAKLIGALLREAGLRAATLYRANLNRAYLTGANLT